MAVTQLNTTLSDAFSLIQSPRYTWEAMRFTLSCAISCQMLPFISLSRQIVKRDLRPSSVSGGVACSPVQRDNDGVVLSGRKLIEVSVD